MSVGRAWTKILTAGERLSMRHLTGQRGHRTTAQDREHRLQCRKILLGDPDDGPIHQRQLDPRPRTCPNHRQFQKVRPACRRRGGVPRRAWAPTRRDRIRHLPTADTHSTSGGRRTIRGLALQLPSPSLKCDRRYPFPSTELRDRKPALALSFQPLPPLGPQNLIHSPSHLGVTSIAQGAKKNTPPDYASRQRCLYRTLTVHYVECDAGLPGLKSALLEK